MFKEFTVNYDKFNRETQDNENPQRNSYAFAITKYTLDIRIWKKSDV